MNVYKPEFQFKRSSNDAKFKHENGCFYLGTPLCYEQNWCAQRTRHHLFKREEKVKFFKISKFIHLFICMY